MTCIFLRFLVFFIFANAQEPTQTTPSTPSSPSSTLPTPTLQTPSPSFGFNETNTTTPDTPFKPSQQLSPTGFLIPILLVFGSLALILIVAYFLLWKTKAKSKEIPFYSQAPVSPTSPTSPRDFWFNPTVTLDHSARTTRAY